MPLYAKIYNKTIFAINYFQGKKIANNLYEKISILNTLTTGSEFSDKYSVLKTIDVKCDNKKLIVKISKNKKITKDLPISCTGEKKIEKQTKITLKKINEKEVKLD